MDSDDVWYPDKMERQARLLADYPEVGFVSGDYLWTGKKGPRPEKSLLAAKRRGMSVPSNQPLGSKAYEILLQINFVGTSSVVVRRSVLEKAGLFDETLPLAEDRDLWLRCARLTTMAVLTGKI